MFEGFSPETVDFLWGIRMNNNREWFTEHKKDYVNHLYEPMKALGQELFQPFLDRPGNILKVSRIYRDARMHHPLPYKESLWICIRQDVQWWGEHPCLYFEINPQGVHYGFFLWQPKTAAMERFRQSIAEKPEEFLSLIHKTREGTGLPVTAECYKRPKAAPTQDLAPYFGWKKAIDCSVHLPFGPEAFDAKLSLRVRELFEKLIPLYTFWCRICND